MGIMIWIEIVQLTLLNILSTIILNLFGKLLKPLIISINADKFFLNFCIESLLGLIGLVCLYSLYKSGFRTINLFAFILIFGYCILNRKNNSFDPRKIFSGISIKPYLYVFFTTAVITFLGVAYTYKGGIDDDIVLYVNIARELGFSGKENLFNYFNRFDEVGTMPYHYLEMWLGALLFKLKWFGLSNAIVFRYGCYGILRTLAITGFLALIESIKKIKIYDGLFAVLFILFNTLFITELFNPSWGIQTSLWLRPNMIIYYIFLFAFFTLVIYKNYSQALLIILLLTIASGPTSPAVYFALFTGLVFLCFINRKDKVQRLFYLKWLAVVIFFALSILLFYKITGVKTVKYPQFESAEEILIYTKTIWKAIVGFLITLPLRAFAIIAIPLFLILLVFNKSSFLLLKNNASTIIFSLLLAGCGIFIFQLTTFMDNTYQFPYVGYAACYITSIYLFYHIINAATSKPINILAIVTVGFFIILNSYHIKNDLKFNFDEDSSLAELNLKRQKLSTEYIKGLSAYLKEKKDLTGGFIYGMDDLSIIDEKSDEHPHSTAQLGSYVYFLNSDICLLPFTDPQKLYEGVDSSTFFYRRYKSCTDILPFYKNTDGLDYNSLLKKYLSENRVDFFITDKNFNIGYLKDICIVNRIIDKNTGHQFIVLCN